mmetsp:Transcript_100387/g.289919  ORF Transcript_100387/g.289919 Transcript_100387/m.289919 type:complete len:329 (+) Transcript_100387:2321-3307(+)
MASFVRPSDLDMYICDVLLFRVLQLRHVELRGMLGCRLWRLPAHGAMRQLQSGGVLRHKVQRVGERHHCNLHTGLLAGRATATVCARRDRGAHAEADDCIVCSFRGGVRIRCGPVAVSAEGGGGASGGRKASRTGVRSEVADLARPVASVQHGIWHELSESNRARGGRARHDISSGKGLGLGPGREGWRYGGSGRVDRCLGAHQHHAGHEVHSGGDFGVHADDLRDLARHVREHGGPKDQSEYAQARAGARSDAIGRRRRAVQGVVGCEPFVCGRVRRTHKRPPRPGDDRRTSLPEHSVSLGQDRGGLHQSSARMVVNRHLAVTWAAV